MILNIEMVINNMILEISVYNFDIAKHEYVVKLTFLNRRGKLIELNQIYLPLKFGLQ